MWALAVFVIATAGIDENGQPILPDHEALNTDDQISARRILKTRHEPRAIFIELLVRAVAEKLERRQNGGFLLDDAAQC